MQLCDKGGLFPTILFFGYFRHFYCVQQLMKFLIYPQIGSGHFGQVRDYAKFGNGLDGEYRYVFHFRIFGNPRVIFRIEIYYLVFVSATLLQNRARKFENIAYPLQIRPRFFPPQKKPVVVVLPIVGCRLCENPDLLFGQIKHC